MQVRTNWIKKTNTTLFHRVWPVVNQHLDFLSIENEQLKIMLWCKENISPDDEGTGYVVSKLPFQMLIAFNRPADAVHFKLFFT